ncbi:MAG: lysylphosphatidylglycerol synthase domain-containing protein [Bacteroidota bacterium]|nr:lysylphosphatidylglycerol synthase domain-containing protein [Bacteroidota bacterium]
MSIKLTITLLAFGFIAWKLIQFDKLPQAWELFSLQLRKSPLIWVLAALAGMPLNFFFEITKWNLLIRKIHHLSFPMASRAVFSGLTMAMLTPNRIGEIFSRVFVLPPDKRIEGIGYSGINSLAQIVIVQLCGLVGMGVLLLHLPFKDNASHPLTYWVILVSIVISIILILIFMNLNWLSRIILLTRLDKKLPGLGKAFESLSKRDKWLALGLSAAKYVTFSLQLFFLLRYFGVDVAAGIGIPSIMTIFLLLNFLPVIAIGEAGIRGSVTLLILGLFSDADLGILAASLVLWMLNVALPALAGSFLMRDIKF